MTLYFFDISVDDDVTRDDIGLEYSDLVDVRRAAMIAIGELAMEHFVTPSGQARLVVSVRNDTGDVVTNAEAWLRVT